MTHGSSYFLQEAVGGLSAGIVGTVIGFPLDTIKTRMQTMQANRNIFSMGRFIVKKEGVFALYRGLIPPLISLSTLNTITFTSYSYFRRDVFYASNGWDIRNGLSGLCIAPMCGIISTVENVIKTQMQMDNVRQKQYQGSLDCIKKLTATHGIRIIYTGHVVNTIREGVFISTYFFTYEGLREALFIVHSSINKATTSATMDSQEGHTTPGEQHHQWAIPVCGGLAGAISWFVSFPLDCIRAGVQGQSFSSGKAHKGALEVMNDLLKTKGIRGLYSGVSPSIVRAFLVSGSRFSAYETALWLLRGGRDNPGPS